MKRISIRQPIINAVDETDPSLSRFQNQMLKWAKYLEKEIGSKNGYKFKAKKFTVTGCSIELPDDCYRPVMVLPGDYEDVCNARYISVEWLQVQSDARTDDDLYSWLWRPAESIYVDPYLWEEVLGELNLLYEFNGTDITLIYQANETDQHGWWIINESHADAITKYIKFKLAAKYNWKINKSDKMLRQGHIAFEKSLERDYNVAVRHARAEDGTTTPYEQEQF